MGLLRLLLAAIVLFEHTGGLGGYAMTGGAVAVQCFFIISGFYMGLVLNERYDRPALNRAFYTNRAIRIFAMYYLFLALHLAVFALVEVQGGTTPLGIYADDRIGLGERIGLGALNFTAIGQELPLWLTVEDGQLAWTATFKASGAGEVINYMMIPMAWSLSLELMFYAVAPFIARRSVKAIVVVLALSLAARALAAGGGLVDDPWSYRFFPFELALFLAGVLAYRVWASDRALWVGNAAKALALAVPVAILTWPWWSGDWPHDQFFSPPRLALLTLVALALPAIHGWSQRSAVDRAIGELSFPVYLGHLLVFAMLGALPLLKASPSLLTIATLLVTCALAWVLVRFVDVRIEALRRRIAARAGAAG
ncbi:acyltransferase [Novosphingobium sp.]|uniref:acyltransferase family protein n=1 Tax=Novosphingobium sp. TaxID=1874826 RepID=UPI0027323953|nr:acyltransferase [Novosphingobium sp.]MDP3906994.1 acyltransferase [Novosphingobium sp.]